VYHDRVTFTYKGEQDVKLRALSVFPRGFVDENFVHLDMFQLPFWVLIEATDTDVTDALSLQETS
jgi:hypothetical protein